MRNQPKEELPGIPLFLQLGPFEKFIELSMSDNFFNSTFGTPTLGAIV